MHPDTRTQVLKAIKQATEDQIKAQDKPVSIIRRFQAKPAPATTPTLEQVEQIMAGQDYPPTTDLLNLLHITPMEADQLSQVDDDDIRRGLLFLAQVTQHTARIRAKAHFLATIGGYSEEAGKLFFVWKQATALRKALQAKTPAAPVPA